MDSKLNYKISGIVAIAVVAAIVGTLAITSIQTNSNSKIPTQTVTILGSDTFDVTDVDATTLSFGPGGAAPNHQNVHYEDVNDDWLTDFLSHYATQETGIGFGDTKACLTGETLDGTPFQACDSISILPTV